MDLIETATKEKLPRGFSYPLGAQTLSKSLAGVPQFDQFRLWFSWRDEYWASKYTKKIEEAGAVSILEVMRGRSLCSDLSWDVRIHAVPSDHAARVKEALVEEEEAFRELRRQLVACQDDRTSFKWALKYDLATRSLSVET